MKQFMKPAIALPILIGIVIGTLLFVLGDSGDAPGLSLVGLVSAFLLILWGVYRADVIPKGFILPILLLCFGSGGLLLSLALLLDGEFEQSPGMAVIGIALGAGMILIGFIKIIRMAKRKAS